MQTEIKHEAERLADAAKTNLMIEGTIWKQLLLFSIPLILGNLLQQMYNTADSIIVGQSVGSNALAAVSASTSLINLLIAFSQGASVGAGVIVSQYLGARDREGVHSSVHTALAIAAILGLALTGAGIALSRQLLIWMQTPDEVMPDAVLYLRIYAGALLFNVMYNMLAGILNAVGNSKRSLIYLAAAAVTNIVLDLVLVCLFDMGVAGAAIATDMSQMASCVLALRFLIKVPASYRVSLEKIRICRRDAVRIIRVGLPTGIQNMVISFSNVLVQSSVNVFGTKAMAGWGAYMKIDGFNILPVTSLSMAATTFTGQNFGAGRLDRVKQGMWVTVLMNLVYTLATGALLLLFCKPLLQLFNADPEVISVGAHAMRYFCPFYFLLGVMHALAGTVRGAGKSIPPMANLLFAMCLFRIFWIQWIVPLFDTIDGVFMLYPVSWLIGLLLMALYAWRGHWLPSIQTG